MREERAYQQKMLNSEKKIVFCNWDRGTGKTYSIANSILKNLNENDSRHSKAIVITNNVNSSLKTIKDRLDEIKYEKDHTINVFNRTRINIIDDFNGDIHEMDVYLVNINELDSIRGIDVDYIYFDECMYDFNSLKQFQFNNLKKVYIIGTFENIEYISDDDLEIKDGIKFIDNQINELLLEFSNTEKSCNTVRTRNDILKQISELQNIKRGMVK